MKQVNYCQNGGETRLFGKELNKMNQLMRKNEEMTRFLEVETDKRRTGCGGN